MFFTVGRVEQAKQNQPNYWSVSLLNYQEELLSWNSRSYRYYPYLVCWDELTYGCRGWFLSQWQGTLCCNVYVRQFLSSVVSGPATGVATGLALGKLKSSEDDFAHLWFDHLEESFSYREVYLKTFFLPVKKAVVLLLKRLMKPGWCMLGTF